MQHYIVNVSSGLASAEALERTIARAGLDHTIALFADVRGHSTHEHAGEDADNYRFLADIERWFGIAIIRIVEGRDIWQVMFDARAITLPVGAARVARCSIDLKREPIDRWIAERYTPETAIQVTGLDWSEPHRIAAFEAAKAPYRCWFPLDEPPYADRCQLAAKWEARGIRPPRLYEQGFTHANCGGFCVKAGQAHFALLYATNKPRYLYHADKEAQFRAEINPKATILRDRRGGETKPITLYEFAARLDAGESYDRDEWGGVRVLCARPAAAYGRLTDDSGAKTMTCPHCGAAPGEPHRCCAVCQRVHPRDVACDGRPIDWTARKARARAWVAANAGLPAHKRGGYGWRETT